MLFFPSLFAPTPDIDSDELSDEDTWSASELEDDAQSDVEASAHFNPTYDDVYAVREDLRQFLPLELADLILESAAYWPCVSVESNRALVVAAGYQTQNNAASYYVVTPAISEQATHIKLVKFILESCDQGWGGDSNNLDTYNGSFTWFEAGIVRDSQEGVVSHLLQLGQRPADEFNADAFGRTLGREIENPLEQTRRWDLQCNMQVSSLKRRHEIVWTKDDIMNETTEAEARARGARTGRNFVNSLSPGDRVVLVVRAQYPGWENHVHRAKVEIFYSVI
ncbi:hypothetical protein FPV67DRAFT_1582039 [Lyophyllum atratum]|nr:hypothetical protein FPV67DRAFT_1582039 [Lyophyllum atratum]